MSDTVNNIANGVTSTKETFSSWDKCMQKTYCKWPVIIVIVVGSLIAISIIFCIARCLCCGAECACCCFRCCAGCCGSGRRGGSGHKRMNSAPAQNAYNAPYRSQPAPSYAPAPLQSPYMPSHSTYEERPQFARFESAPKPINEDALPAMPSWKDAKSTRVEDTSPVDDVEMKPLNPSGDNMATAAPAATPLGRSPVQSPNGEVDAYRFAAQAQRNNSYNTTGGYHTGPYQSSNSFRGQSANAHQGYGGNAQNVYEQRHYQSHNDGYQESGVYHNQDSNNVTYNQQSHSDSYGDYNNGYGSRNQNYNADPYARQTSPNYAGTGRQDQHTTPYPQDEDHSSYQSQQQSGWLPQPVQQQGGWQTRKPVEGTWKEM